MKIKILKNDAHCLAQFKNGRYEVGDVCVDDCCFDHEVHEYIKHNSHSDCCITQSIGIDAPFFFQIILYHDKKVTEECACIGHLTKDGPIYVINIDKIVEGQRIYPEQHHKFLITSYFPSKNFFNGDFARSILTSDGVITLEKNQFIGVRDDSLEELDVQEVLDIISTGETENSPKFSALRLAPVSKRPSRPRSGTFIYNKNNSKLEFYDGKQWRQV